MMPDDYVKIGRTKNVEDRLSKLQTGNPFNINPIGFIPTAEPMKIEKAFHHIFNSFRRNGEWFKLDEVHVANLICILSFIIG
jgi:hypothetical protein